MKSQKFFGYQVPGLENEEITAYFGLTTDGMMLVSTSAGRMCSLTLPQ